MLLLEINLVNLIDRPVARSVLPDVLTSNFILLAEDLESASGILSLTSDDETLASWWLGTLERLLCDLLQAHTDGQQRLEHAIVKLDPVRLARATVHLSQLLEAFVHV